MRDFLRNPDAEAYSQIHPLTDPLIRRFQEYAKDEFGRELNHEYTKEVRETNLQIALAITILQLNKIYRKQNEATSSESTFFGRLRRGRQHTPDNYLAGAMAMLRKNMNYLKEKGELEKLPGCAGGGSMYLLTSAGSPRNAESTSSKNYDFEGNGMCVVCHKGPQSLGPCDICIPCDARLGGRASKFVA
jgi:hypothetical protein